MNEPPRKKKSSIVPLIIIIFVVILLFVTVFSFMLRIMSGSFLKRYGLKTASTTMCRISRC